MPSPKDRQNSGISMAEKEEAAEYLNTALKVLNRYHWWASLPDSIQHIRAAMATLGMQEDAPKLLPGSTVLNLATGEVHQEPGRWADNFPDNSETYPPGYPELGG